MARRLIGEKLESMRRCIERIRGRRPPTLDALKGDLDAQDVVVLNLTRAVQLAVDAAAHFLAEDGAAAPDTMGATFDALAEAGAISSSTAAHMRAAVGFRNIAIHSYRSLDLAIVHAIATERLVDFEEFARELVASAEL